MESSPFLGRPIGLVQINPQKIVDRLHPKSIPTNSSSMSSFAAIDIKTIEGLLPVVVPPVIGFFGLEFSPVIRMRKSYKKGERIKSVLTSETIEGEVVSKSFFTTKIINNKGEIQTIPNRCLVNPIDNLTLQDRWPFEMSLEFSLEQEFESIKLIINKVLIEENVIDPVVEVVDFNASENSFKIKVSGYVVFKQDSNGLEKGDGSSMFPAKENGKEGTNGSGAAQEEGAIAPNGLPTQANATDAAKDQGTKDPLNKVPGLPTEAIGTRAPMEKVDGIMFSANYIRNLFAKEKVQGTTETLNTKKVDANGAAQEDGATDPKKIHGLPTQANATDAALEEGTRAPLKNVNGLTTEPNATDAAQEEDSEDPLKKVNVLTTEPNATHAAQEEDSEDPLKKANGLATEPNATDAAPAKGATDESPAEGSASGPLKNIKGDELPMKLNNPEGSSSSSLKISEASSEIKLEDYYHQVKVKKANISIKMLESLKIFQNRDKKE